MLPQGFGIGTHEIVTNFLSGERTHFPDDQDFSPETFAEQYVDPDPSKAQPSSELLKRARMMIATELGKDPILRQAVRDRFKMHGKISVLPTDRGLSKIDENHPYFVSTARSRGT